MDETLAISYNDLDLCLRFIERGYRNVWTPYAELYHQESGSRGYDNSPVQLAKANREKKRFLARWGPLACTDPCYNPNLADQGRLYGLAFPPRLGEHNALAGPADARPPHRVTALRSR
jgi:hypothetical protein